ncbi:calcium-binding protein [Gymnodinialimonas hymeniacidonis]|uniref:calcium-binding protein n=1 Tax=Gymnodinialimonas hymeniacidonis TaxID=3126508 RepID=UPI0034C606EB
MLVAGSVLALLLAGLTVDGLFNPETEDEENEAADGADSPEEASGGITTLDELLPNEEDAEDPSLQTRAETLGYTPLDDVDMAEDSEVESEVYESTPTPEGAGANALLEVTETTVLDDGAEVPLVSDFLPGTDMLVMDFDGGEKDAPVITIDSDPETDDAVINANGQPVTIVQDAADMTEKDVLIQMSGVEEDAVGLTDGLGLIPELPIDLPDDLGDIPLIDPIVDVVETVTDGVPGAAVLEGIMDDLGSNLSDLGGTSDMLDARGDIDAAFGTGGEDALTGSFNDDVLSGGDGQDALFGDDGDDVLSGGGGNDELHGDFGDDDLHGGDGIDFLDGGEGDDALDGGAGRDALFGGDGNDALYGGSEDDVLHGGAGADTLNGGSGNDLLNGTFSHGTGDQDQGDVLLGGSGDDEIILGNGDIAQGGTGADTFVSGDHIVDDASAGTVSDFNPSEDRIEVIYDPDTTPNPIIEVQDFADGSGADIMLNGQVVLSVTGAQGLDPNVIDLRTSA